MNRPRFLADHDLNDTIVAGMLRQDREVTFIRARDLGLDRASDDDVLAAAERLNACVVSHDFNTMPAAAARAIEAGHSFPGLFLVQQTTSVRIAIDSLMLVWSASAQEEWRDVVIFLPF